MQKVKNFINVQTGKSNTQDAVENGKYIFIDRSQILKKSSKYIFDTEAIIVPGEGQEFRPIYINGKFDLHQRCYCLTSVSDHLKIKYLYYFLEKNKDYFARVATGSTVKSLRKNDFLNIELNIPNLQTQQHIVNTMFWLNLY